MGYDTDDFEKDVIERSYRIPVLVDFWAEWCGPCQVLGPTLEKLAAEQADRWALVKLNTERHPAVARQYGIRSIPNVKLFVDGEAVNEFSGALPEEMVLRWLDQALPSPNRDRLKQAQQLLAQNKVFEAQDILRKIIEAEPGNDQARIFLAQTLLYTDPQSAEEIVEPIEPGSPVYDIAEATRAFSRLFQYVADPALLPEGRMKEAYLAAVRHLKERRFEPALEGFIDVIQRDRAYDDEGARKACIAIFRTLGEQHDISRKYRRAFSSALHA